ncbi:hypothetical protein HNQ10_003769 [Deinococcus metallilatus]|uniref:Uncharacterized protein n=1 Tax=Deinococcus metallilatus TaxID=1211322 RepID=A0ABR6MY84_9DEIO|nr:hypothetical protein [Deinococcus metallilatus]
MAVKLEVVLVEANDDVERAEFAAVLLVEGEDMP